MQSTLSAQLVSVHSPSSTSSLSVLILNTCGEAGINVNDTCGEAGINVHNVFPVTTPRGKQMMSPADRIYDPGQGAKKDLTDTGDDFLAIGPALRIMQRNVEGLSAAKREVISSIA